MVSAAIMITELMNLSMTVVTARDAVISTGSLNLIVLQTAEFQACLLIARLQKATSAPATIVIGAVGLHIDKIFLPYDGFHHKPKIFGDRVSIAFPYNLAGILGGKLDL